MTIDDSPGLSAASSESVDAPDDTADLTDALTPTQVDGAASTDVSAIESPDEVSSVVSEPVPADTTEPAQPVADSVWRYHLDVLVGEAAGSQVWQATDPVLGRKVGVRLLPTSDPRAEDLREAACLAARISDRRLVHVLDVVDVRFDGAPHVAVVTEWFAGRALQELLTEPMAAAEATTLCADVAECLLAAHQEGIAHGRLRPSSILIGDNGEVRIRGLGTEAVLRGCDPNPDPAVSDVNGVGGLLYACTTGRWPYGAVDGLSAAPLIGGGVPLPSRVAPSVAAITDTLCSRSVAGCTPPKDTVPYSRMSSLATDLRAAATQAREAATPTTVTPRRRRRTGRRLVATVIGLLAVGGLALLGWQLVSGSPAAFTPRVSSSSPSALPSASLSSSLPITPVERPLAFIRVSDYDPLGNGAENPDLATLATDGKAATAWTTVVYKEDYLSGKDGVGLLLDLGASRPVKAVRLSLLGGGTDLQVLTSDEPSDDPASFSVFGSAVGAPGETTIRSPRTVSARYVLIWLTRVPALDTGYQGGISEVTVLG